MTRKEAIEIIEQIIAGEFEEEIIEALKIAKRDISTLDLETADIPEGTFPCDPNKATECPKTNCFINGGLCHATTKEEWAKEGVEEA